MGFKSLKKEIKENIRKCSWIGRINTVKITMLQKQSTDSVQSPSKSQALKEKYSASNEKNKNPKYPKQFCAIKELLEVSPSLTLSSTIQL